MCCICSCTFPVNKSSMTGIEMKTNPINVPLKYFSYPLISPKPMDENDLFSTNLIHKNTKNIAPPNINIISMSL